MRSRESVSLVVATILVVVSALGALKLKRERDAVRSTLSRYAAVVPLAVRGPAAAARPEGLLEILTKAKQHIERGQYALADEQLAQVRRQPLPPAGRATAERKEEAQPERPRRERGAGDRALRQPLGPARGRAMAGVSPKARELFDAHADLSRRARALAGAIMARRSAGDDVREAHELLRQAIAAAEEGDARRVAELIRRTERALGGAPEAPARAPEGRQARPSPRRDGQRQPQRPARGRPRGAGAAQRPPTSQMAAARRLVEILIATMTQEQEALNKARTSIANAELALREKNQEQVREILRTATVQLAHIERGRQALAAPERRGPRRPSEREGREPPGRGAGPRLARPVPVPVLQPREALAQIRDAFDKARALGEDEYAERQQRLAVALLERIVVSPREPDGKPGGEAPGGLPVTEDVVRRKLQAAEEPYRDAEASGSASAGQARGLLGDARRLLYDAQYQEADELLDRTLELLGVTGLDPAGKPVSEQPRREERERVPAP